MAKTFLPTTSQIREIDAKNQTLGRVATQIATILRGKDKPQFAPNKIVGDKVRVINIEHIRFSGNKMKQKKYYRHTGYLGNLKTITLEELWKKSPAKVLQKAVYGMLPRNRLRKELMKRLEIVTAKE